VSGDLPPDRTRFFAPGDGALGITTAVGVLVEHKGIDILIEAACLLRALDQGTFWIDINGREDDDRFRRLAADGAVDDVVRFRGLTEQKELIRRLSGCDVFAFPTAWREPFAFAPLEAAAAGCVPLISSTSGNAEWMVGGVHCLKAPRTPQAFADALAAILRGDIDLAPIGRRAQAAVRDMFHSPTVLPAVEAALFEAAAAPGAENDRLLNAAAAAEACFRNPA
jgi:glycosyltransferase involved in cell wall biosynthesis